MKPLSKVGWSVVAMLATLLGGGFVYRYVTADPPGYCRAQQRYISDDEFIKTTIALVEWQKNSFVEHRDGSKKKLADTTQVFRTLEGNRSGAGFKSGFITMDRSDTHTIYRWLYGYQQIQVVLNANSGDSWQRTYFDVCGKFIDSDFGGSYPGNEKLTTANYLEILNKK